MSNNDRVTSSASTTRGTRTPKLDELCAAAVDLARAAVTEDVAGDYVEAEAEGDRVVTHYFECTLPGYRGWRWAVTVARAPRSKLVTISETVLLPGPDALTPPAWVPWEERVRPGDLGVGDLMPTPAEDDRLVPGYLLSDDPAIEDVVWELGLGRSRVLSRDGRLDTAERWHQGDHGPNAAIALAAPSGARCVSCGFYLPLAGAMRAAFGACANLYAPDDGSVVSADHGCGAHSEVLIESTVEVDEAPTVFDDSEVVDVEVHGSEGVEAYTAEAAEATVDAEPAAGMVAEAGDVAGSASDETGEVVETPAEMGAPESAESTEIVTRE